MGVGGEDLSIARGRYRLWIGFARSAVDPDRQPDVGDEHRAYVHGEQTVRHPSLQPPSRAKQEFLPVDRKLPTEFPDRRIELDTVDVGYESDRCTAREVGIAVLRDLHIRTGFRAEQCVGLLGHLLNRIYSDAVRFKG